MRATRRAPLLEFRALGIAGFNGLKVWGFRFRARRQREKARQLQI